MRLISPNSLMPISTTAAAYSGESRSTVSGTPIWLFWFPSVLRTFFPAETASAAISLVVVFPTLPVTPTTGPANFFRHAAAIFCSARRVSSTAIQAPPPGETRPSCVSAAAAPAANALPMKRCASVLSPAMGTNSAPGPISLLSVEAEVSTASGSPPSRVPPQAAAASFTVIRMPSASQSAREDVRDDLALV